MSPTGKEQLIIDVQHIRLLVMSFLANARSKDKALARKIEQRVRKIVEQCDCLKWTIDETHATESNPKEAGNATAN